jgi:uncharacterized protein YndB with AHSA1/START domain
MATASSTLERSLLIDAPRATVWEAIAEPERLGRWLLPSELGATLARTDDRLCIDIGGFLIADVARIETLEPPGLLVMRGMPDEVLSIAWSLADAGAQTRVTVTMSGFERLAADAIEDRIAASGPAWEKALANLAAFVTGAQLPHNEGLVAALLGYRRHGGQMLAVERSIWVQAPRPRVWDAITEPAQVGAWYSPGTPWQRSSDGVGGRLTAHDPESGEETHAEVIEVTERPDRYVTRSAARPGHDSQVTSWVLTEEAGGTRVTITISGYESQAATSRERDMEQNAFGFGMALQNLRAYLDGRELPYPGGF